MRVVVTGGSGRAGRYIIPELMEHGHEVVNADVVRREDVPGRFMYCDFTDYGQTLSTLRDAEAVIHMAAIPSPVMHPHEVVFRVNMMSTWNVLQAAEVLGINKLVLASSINAIGATYSLRAVPPLYFPIDEEHPTRAEESYSLSKWLGEQMADGFARKRPVQIASFRFHALLDDARLQEFKKNPITDPVSWAKHFWGYTHLKDAARACRLAIEADWTGHHAFFINASDTVLSIPTEEAIRKAYPGVPIKKTLAKYQSAIDPSKAKRVFGWEPLYSWRNM